MVTMDNDGIKVDGVYRPFAVYEECDGCSYSERLREVEGEKVDRLICKMAPEVEDRFLFSDMRQDRIPPCLQD